MSILTEWLIAWYDFVLMLNPIWIVLAFVLACVGDYILARVVPR